jgi:hypothetical protein
MASTAWGDAKVVEEVVVKQKGSGREFATLVQLLETDAGTTLVRFAYSTGGSARRGPVTLRETDLARLRQALARAPALRAALARAI